VNAGAILLNGRTVKENGRTVCVRALVFVCVCVCVCINVSSFCALNYMPYHENVCRGMDVRTMSSDVELSNRFCKVECNKKKKKIYIF
jgi:hypothetical protein